MWEQIKKIVLTEEERVNSGEEAAVIQRSKVLFGISGRKEGVGGGLSRV